MKAYNARKTPKEHWLFSKRGRKIHLVGNSSVKISVKKKDGNIFPCKGEARCKMAFILYQVDRIDRRHFFSIGRYIKQLEKREGLKIEEIGLTRKDFANDLQNIERIIEKVDEYKGEM